MLGHSPFRRWFRVALAIKGIDGLLETVGGLLLLAIPSERLNALLEVVVAREISNHPDDWIGDAVHHMAQTLSVSTQRFASFYLVGHGLVKIVLVAALWRERAWAFPIALWFMGFFLLYQIYRATHTHSVALIVFTAIDLVVLWVIWRDRELLRRPLSR